MPTAFSYIRFSSAKQKHGDSYGRQQEKVAEWARANPDYVISETTYEDLGLSGFTGKHRNYGFGRLLAAIENGDIKDGDVILAEHWDRVGRLPTLVMLTDLITPILSAGVKIITLVDGEVYDTDALDGYKAHVLIGHVQQAHKYSSTLSERVNSSYTRRRDDAAAGIKTPVRCTPLWLTKEGVVIEDIAKHVAHAFAEYASGIGERAISRQLRESGHPALSKTTAATVVRWISNKTAIGYWSDIPGVYEGIVDPALFYACQKVKEDKKSRPNSKSPSRHPLTGLIKCSECGRNYNVQVRKNSFPVMLCTSRIRVGSHGCTNNKAIPLTVLEHLYELYSFPFIKRAYADNALMLSNKRLGEVELELEAVNVDIVKWMGIVEATDGLEEATKKLAGFNAQRKKLQDEKLVLQKTDLASLQGALADESAVMLDPMKRRALLIQREWAIKVGHDGTLSVPNASLSELGDAYEYLKYKYIGSRRAKGVFVVSDGFDDTFIRYKEDRD